MRTPQPGTERLGAFSDGVLAIIITIMVLDLKAPHDASPDALLALWPTFLSYALSYLFIGVFWANHHHMLQYAERASHTIIWANLLVLFFVSLIPFFTAYMAENRMQPFTTALYAGVFFLVTVAFMILQKTVANESAPDGESKQRYRTASKRNWIALVAYVFAIFAAWLHPALSLIVIFGIAALYFIPDAFSRRQSKP